MKKKIVEKPKRRDATFKFKTRAAALAFVQGVQFVNDSSLEILAVDKQRGKNVWNVLILDWDAP